MSNFKKMFFGLAALVLAFGLVFSVSAFKLTEKKGTIVYYKYNGSLFNETGYRNIEDWEPVIDPEAVTCGGDSDICVLKVDEDNLPNSGTMLEKLDDFFNSQLNTPGAVNSYVTDDDNIEAQKN